jgi:hypothetical protein
VAFSDRDLRMPEQYGYVPYRDIFYQQPFGEGMAELMWMTGDIRSFKRFREDISPIGGNAPYRFFSSRRGTHLTRGWISRDRLEQGS